MSMTAAKSLVVRDEAEEAAINRGIAEDSDTWEPSAAEWARARPLSQADPELHRALITGDYAVVIRRGDAADAPEIRRVSVKAQDDGWLVEAQGDVSARRVFKDRSAAIECAQELTARPTGVPTQEPSMLRPPRKPKASTG